MEECKVTVANPLGMHTRAAASFVQIASRFKADIRVCKDDLIVDGKSIMSIMMLGAASGEKIIIQAKGPEAKEALEQLIALVGKRKKKVKAPA
ncbi:HPr family phosphocarrier protein [Magnetococcales bacterium HHB-1]